LPWFSAVPETSLGARVTLWGGRELVGLVLASLVAGLATTLFAAYHFHRLAPYGVLANLLAMPIVSGWVMPAGLLALVAIPFGFDGLLWWLMGEGIGWMIAVATFVASLPGAVGRIPAFGIGAVLAGTAGLIVICLLRSPLRWSGIALLVLTVFLALRTQLPDVLVASDGRIAAVRGADGRLRVIRTGSDDFAVRDWLAADGDARTARDPALSEGTRCDELGCIARLADGKLVALSLTTDALAEDCSRAAIVITARNALAGCAASAIDRDVWGRAGAISLKWNGKSFDREAANPPGHLRPWTRSRELAQRPETAAAPVRPAPRDATPRLEDIDPGDQ
jgi:competence protein ComEC